MHQKEILAPCSALLYVLVSTLSPLVFTSRLPWQRVLRAVVDLVDLWTWDDHVLGQVTGHDSIHTDVLARRPVRSVLSMHIRHVKHVTSATSHIGSRSTHGRWVSRSRLARVCDHLLITQHSGPRVRRQRHSASALHVCTFAQVARSSAVSLLSSCISFAARRPG